MPDWVPHFIADGLAWEAVKKLFIWLAEWVAVSLGLTVLFRYALDLIKERRQVLALWAATFLVLGAGFYFTSERAYGPKLQGAIFEGSVGPWSDALRPNGAAVFMVCSITNAGNVQSIATNFQLNIKNKGNTYQGELTQIPEVLEAPSMDEKFPIGGFKFYGKDSLYVRAATPIPPGGVTYGLLIFIFPNVDWHVFEGTAELNLSFSDAFSTNYFITRMVSGTPNYLFHAHPGVQIDVIPKISPEGGQKK